MHTEVRCGTGGAVAFALASAAAVLLFAASPGGAAPFPSDATRPPAADLRAMLAAVCGAGQVVVAGSPARPECRSVPAYPTPCKQSLAIDLAVTGSFTAPGAAEAVADYEGCEPHAGNFGGSVLLRRRAAGWERVSFLPGERTRTCLRFRRPDGRDALACYASWSGQGEEDGAISLLSLDARGHLTTTDLRRFTDVSWDPAICNRTEVGHPQSLESFAGWSRLAPTAASQPPRLVVRYRAESFTVPAFCAAAPENAPDGDATIARFAAWRRARARAAAVTFEWRNGAFAHAPAGR